ncbi:hypothetical protein BDQ12DRAFT_699252 [Crucibulum laeve]|uniref:RRM domain-containing protein n=1 Tax=Crucibulum laeve TaxID=68775 RepID=A0A5C3LVM2_9AGAR|nr:hypothetical protein BDQ12DRAFT_699252 [Crucibulum laeve]
MTSDVRDDPITKRLHVSGLTPTISAEDINKRLSTFGTVRSVDGVGLLDGLGQPRKFGYVTIETTTGKLAKCMNLLSGSTWKGTKLRIGEAKADFAERIAAENQKSLEEPPKKRRKRFGAVEAADMSPITPENVGGKGGWKVTPMGRIVRPVRMRPEHPLPPMLQEEQVKKAKSTSNKKEEEKKKKKRAKDPDSRARRRTIDPTKWGSTHLKGIFLDVEASGTRKRLLEDKRMDESTNSSEGESEEESEKEGAPAPAPVATNTAFAPAPEVPPTRAPSPQTVHIAPVPSSAPPTTKSTALPDNNTDIALEKAQTFNLLYSLFGGKDDDDWVGRESVGSDVDEEELSKRVPMVMDEDDGDFEVVPMEDGGRRKKGYVMVAGKNGVEEDDEEEEDEMEVGDTLVKSSPEPVEGKVKGPITLRDLFAPREEEAGFSLLGHLDLDLELDEELPFTTETVPESAPIPAYTPSFSIPLPSSVPSTAPINLNLKQALFFPLPADSTAFNKNARPKDLFDLAKEGGWNWRDPAFGFYRTDTEEGIRKRWEEQRGELTQGWKKRCREAGKVSRRRGKGVDADAE